MIMHKILIKVTHTHDHIVYGYTTHINNSQSDWDKYCRISYKHMLVCTDFSMISQNHAC